MLGVAVSLRDGLRNMLKIRVERSLPRRTGRPPVGARIFCADVRMTVQAGLSLDLWNWLQDEGWRRVNYKPDRRAYYQVPAAWVTRLIDAPPEQRAIILHTALKAARAATPREDSV